MKTKLLLDLITSLLLIFSQKITMVFMKNEASPSPFYEILFITKIICFILAVFYLNHGITTFYFQKINSAPLMILYLIHLLHTIHL